MSRIPENAINQVKTKRLQILNHEEMTFRQDLVVEIQGFKLFVEKFFYVTLKKNEYNFINFVRGRKICH